VQPDTDPVAATLDGWREAELNATAAPWEVHHGSAIGIRLASDELDWPLAEGFRRAADAEFSAAARTAMPRLLAAVEAALAKAHELMDTPWPEDGGDRAGTAAEQAVLDGIAFREAITTALTGQEAGGG
jgi:hypothetical protein